MDPIATIGQVIVAGGLTGARPALTLCLLQVYVALFAAEAMPEEIRWVIHAYAIAAVAVLAIVEHFARSDPDLDEILHWPNVVIGAVAGAFTAVLLIALREGGSQGEVAAEPEVAAAPFELARAGLFGSGETNWTLLVVGAVLASLASVVVAVVRRKILAALDVVAVPSRAVRWVETGTVTGALGLVLLLPAIAAVLAALLVVASVAGAFMVRAVEKRRDETGRRTCECGQKVRKEALVCPECGRDLEPEVRLGDRREDSSEEEG